MFEDDDREDAGPCVRILRRESGYVAQGPDFTVWDEDLKEVLRAAHDLGRGAPVISSSARFLVIRSSEWVGGEGLAANGRLLTELPATLSAASARRLAGG